MVKQVKFIQLEVEPFIKLELYEPIKQPLERKNDLSETIATTKEEVVAIYAKQQAQYLRRLYEIEQILLRELNNVAN